LQQKGNHGVSDDPPKTLSSRSQTLSKLQPVEPPQERPYSRNAQRTQVAAGARDPRGGRTTGFSAAFGRNSQSRIVLLAPLPGKRKPAIRSQACNALNLRAAVIYSDISCGL